MVKSAFLDTCVFFECALNSKTQTILNHAVNVNFPLVTSITVMGEAIDQMRKQFLSYSPDIITNPFF